MAVGTPCHGGSVRRVAADCPDETERFLDIWPIIPAIRHIIGSSYYMIIVLSNFCPGETHLAGEESLRSGQAQCRAGMAVQLPARGTKPRPDPGGAARDG